MQLSPNHYFLTSASDIEAIVAPLKKYHISYFAYARSYADGSRILLSSHVDDFQAYLTNKHYLVGNCEAKPRLYKKQAVLWSTLPNQHLYQFSKNNFNIDHGLTLIEPAQDYSEFFAFASTNEHPEVVNFYLNNLDIIQKYTTYFKDKARKIIQTSENHKIKFPHHNKSIDTYTMQDLQIACSKRKISPRQLQCINLLLSGATAKEIASQLSISTRTAEYYIHLLKIKFNAKNKADLIAKLLNGSHKLLWLDDSR